MVTLVEFVKRGFKLDDFIRRKSPDLLMKQASKIVTLNNEQLIEGKGFDSKIMQSGYSPGYAKIRQRKGLQTGFVDLKFSGKYQDSRKAQKAKDGINIVSNVDYEKHLRNNFPTHVGLTEKNAEQIKKLVAKDLAVEIEKYLSK